MYVKSFLLTMICLLVYGVSSLSAAGHETVEYNWGGSPVYMSRVADNFIILYDRSESMGSQFLNTGMTKLQAERKILREKNATLPDMNWQAGIYSFTPGLGAENLTTYYPMQPYDKVLFSRTISEMPREPRGATLLQQGLAGLQRVMSGLQGKTVVFLFTDGQYSPVDHLPAPAAQARMIASAHDVCFVVIDTGNESKSARAINNIAAVNDCSYVVPFGNLLGNPEWMTNSLFTVVEKKPEMMDTAVEAKEVMIGYEWENILFDFDKSDIKPEYHAILADVGKHMRDNPDTRVILSGHCDNVGTWEYNIKLSHRRAASVRDYLVEKEFVEAERITLSGFGYDDPIATNDTAEGRAQNRRVQGIITRSN